MLPLPINKKFFYLCHKETLFPVNAGKNWLSPLKQSIFNMVVGLYSSIWLLRFRIESFTMDRWDLVSLVTHFNWLGFFEKFLASSSLQQFQAKSSVDISELKWLSWLRPPPNTLKTKTSYLIRTNNSARFDYWDGRKTLLYFRPYGLMT